MIQRKSLVTRVVCAVLLALTACKDLPTAVVPSTPAPPPSAPRSAGGLHLGQSPLVCSLGRPAPAPATGWQTRRDTIFLPRSEFDGSSQMVRYLFVQMGSGGKVAYAASCMVPYTEAALRRVDRHFGVSHGGGADQFVVRQGMVTTQDCTIDENTNSCVFDPLMVTAPPVATTYDPCEVSALSCISKTPGGGSDDGWSDPNGPWSGGSAGTGGEEEEDGPGIFSACVIGLLTVAGGTAMLLPVIKDMYEKARAVDSAERMLIMVRENNGSSETIARYESELSSAKQSYNDAVLNVALAAGATTLAVIGAVAVCSPTLIVPVP